MKPLWLVVGLLVGIWTAAAVVGNSLVIPKLPWNYHVTQQFQS